jgi:hypothetical protein
MGVRFHKVLGYGITGLSVDESGMHTNDPRINLESPIFDGENDDYTDEAYRDHLQEITADLTVDSDPYDPRFELSFEKFAMEDLIKKQKGASWEAYRGVVYSGEYGDAATLLVIPPGMANEWSRYGDALDHAEAQINGDDGMPSVRFIDTPLYPFYGWMDARTGDSLSKDDKTKREVTETLLQAIDSPRLVDDEKKRLKALLAKHLELWGFTDLNDYKATIVPAIPAGVKDLCGWLNIFTDEDGWKALRPMLYTYWG